MGRWSWWKLIKWLGICKYRLYAWSNNIINMLARVLSGSIRTICWCLCVFGTGGADKVCKAAVSGSR